MMQKLNADRLVVFLGKDVDTMLSVIKRPHEYWATNSDMPSLMIWMLVLPKYALLDFESVSYRVKTKQGIAGIHRVDFRDPSNLWQPRMTTEPVLNALEYPKEHVVADESANGEKVTLVSTTSPKCVFVFADGYTDYHEGTVAARWFTKGVIPRLFDTFSFTAAVRGLRGTGLNFSASHAIRSTLAIVTLEGDEAA